MSDVKICFTNREPVVVREQSNELKTSNKMESDNFYYVVGTYGKKWYYLERQNCNYVPLSRMWYKTIEELLHAISRNELMPQYNFSVLSMIEPDNFLYADEI